MNNAAIAVEIDEEALEVEEKKAYEERISRLQSLSGVLVKKRDEAIEARQLSGIEDDWREDEDHYEGIDDANRDFYRNRAKPLSPEGGSEKTKDKTVRSRIFLNITRPYVDAAAAKVADMLLPTDEQNWGIEPTPIPSLVKNNKSSEPLVTPQGEPVMNTETGNQITVGEHAEQILTQATKAAEDAETRIDDWLTESRYNHETRKVIESCARLGTGIIKGPYPVARQASSINKEGGLTSIVRKMEIYPESRAIDCWDLYPDSSCGNDIHNGSHVFERGRLTIRGLEDLKQDDSYLSEMIDMCLVEGPQKKNLEEREAERQSLNLDNKSQFDIWYYTGFISPEDMEAAGCPCDSEESVPAIIIMVNDRVIKAAVNPLDSGAFPYDVMTWQDRDGYWAGIGVSRQIRTPQRMLNAGVRNIMDNAGLMSGPQIVVRRSAIEPENGQWSLSPRKVWFMNEDAVGTVNDAFTAINIPSMQEQLFSIVQYAQKMAEDVTGLPMLLQGQQGAAPETVGGMQMLNNNASTVMRRIARTYDDKVTSPHISRYYEWLLLDPDVPESEKGDYKIVAKGSSALVERDIQNQNIAQMAGIVANPAFGLDPKKWVQEHFKSQRLNPELFMHSEEELKAIAEQAAANPPQDPAMMKAQASIEAAKLRTDGMVQVAQARTQEQMTQRELDLQEAREDRQFKLEMAQLARETKMLELAHKTDQSIQQIKAQLADTAIKERNKKEMQAKEIEVKKEQGSGI